ncbi:MAG TPA: methyltransferase domain-containing protein [Opitutales bacterium]|nr:methyltransferase domain-containing protein [Opitutales bacterium]
MGFTLDSVVPWGRSFDEYVRMFDLSAADLEKRIFGCGDGPAAFNATLAARGGRIVSADPVYAFSAKEIEGRIDVTYEKVMAQLRANAGDYLWTEFSGPEEVGATRMAAMKAFLADYEAGRAAGRYVAASVPELPFADASFDLALVSHFLFLYAAQMDADFHVRALRELLRVAKEVRVFPILTLDGRPYPEMEAVRSGLEESDVTALVRRVPYEFQKGGNEMMVLRRI